MSEYKRLTTQSDVFDGATLKDFCESCGEDDCRAFCCDETETPQCGTCPVQKAFDRLAKYEDIGSLDELSELKNENHQLNAFCDKLNKAETEERLVVLPCKVGDTVYVDIRTLPYNYLHPQDKCRDFAKCEVIGFYKTKSGVFIKMVAQYPSRMNKRGYLRYGIGAISKTVFLNREDAEAVLKAVRSC